MNFWVWKKFGSEKYLGAKKMWIQKYFGFENNFGSKNFFESEKKNVGPKSILGMKNKQSSGPKYIFTRTRIFFYPEQALLVEACTEHGKLSPALFYFQFV